jgi:membrane protease subunit (stomatin/prohibitin family)
MYNVKIPKDRMNIVKDAAKFEDHCPVDAICDSIPSIIEYIVELEEKIKLNATEIQKLQADKRELERKINNVRSQKFRQIKKRGK